MNLISKKRLFTKKIKKQKKRVSRSTAGNIAIFLLLACLGAFMVLPVVYAVASALKPIDELYLFPPTFFVKRPTLSNFKSLFNLTSNLWVPFSRYVFNSVFVTATATIAHIAIASMAAYPLALYRLKINWIFKVVVLALLFNGVVLWLPQYIILSKLNMINTYLALILPILPMPLGLFLMKQFMEQVPRSVIESASIDGASHIRTFSSIVLPMVKPAILTLLVFAFQTVWNQQNEGVIFDEQLKLLNTAISSVVGGGIMRLGASMAGGLLLMIPPIMVFVFSQNSVIETMAHSGVKE